VTSNLFGETGKRKQQGPPIQTKFKAPEQQRALLNSASRIAYKRAHMFSI